MLSACLVVCFLLIGVEYFLEAGPGKVLTGLVKRTLRKMPCQNIEDLKTLEKAAALLQKE